MGSSMRRSTGPDFQHGKGLGLIWSRASNANAVRASKEILEELAGALILPSTIVPSAEGGISIYFMTAIGLSISKATIRGLDTRDVRSQWHAEVLEIGATFPEQTWLAGS